MKRFCIISVLITTVVVLLSSCSAQRQLYNLLQRHPELRTTDSVIVMSHEVIVPGATNLVLLPRISNDDDPCNCDSLLREALKDGISTTAGNAQATVLSTDSGIGLQVEQVPDTIFVPDTIRVPQYIIKEAPRDESNGEVFFRISGIIAWLLVALAIVVCLFVIFLKR